jgi:hypothetical protein
MNTTEFFVEHLIAGVQALLWILLIFLSFFGIEWVPFGLLKDYEIIISGIAISIVYPLGVMVDHVADSLLKKQHNRIKKRYPDNLPTMALSIKTNNDVISHLVYIRKRIRLMRSFIINVIFSIFAGNLFIFTQLSKSEAYSWGLVSFALTIAGTIFLVISYWAWRDITDAYYKRVSHATEILK